MNGSIVWADGVNGTGSQVDEAIGITLDSAGAVVATSYTWAGTSFDTWTRKYTDNGVTNTVVWTKTYNGLANGTDFGSSVAADANGNVVVAGGETVAGQLFNTWVRKYDAAGTTVWTQTYDDVAHLNDQGNGVAVDANGNVIVVGTETLASLEGPRR